MIFGKKGQKKRHPYLGIAVLGLAAAGAVSIYNKGMTFIKEKMPCAMFMKKQSGN